MLLRKLGLLLSLVLATAAVSESFAADAVRFIQVSAKTREDRTQLSNLGMSIEAIRTDAVWGFVSPSVLDRIEKSNHKILGNFDMTVARGGHQAGFLDFPPQDSRFHNYDRVVASLNSIHSLNADITTLQSIGKSTEGRDLWALHINTNPEALKTGTSNKPGVIFMGTHHAREHVSTEIPLMLAEYLLKNRGDDKMGKLIDSRDIWIIPLVNPDGSEHDVKTGDYQFWRKNRRPNTDGTMGVDLNRNYGFKWGTGGSSNDGSSDVYMGTAPFSEPETQAIRDFVKSKSNTKVLLSFHTFSELILYPWGHTYDKVGEHLGKTQDHDVFVKMAETMAQWNHYTPEQSSALYIASGDTTDWAYGELGIFAFTFELSPSQWGGAGGFYPGQGIIDQVFNDNLKPCMYLIDTADNPYKVIANQPSRWLKHIIEPSVPSSFLPITTSGRNY